MRRAIITRYPHGLRVMLLEDGRHVRTEYPVTRWGARRIAQRWQPMHCGDETCTDDHG